MAAQFDCANCGDVTPQRYLCKACRLDLKAGKFWTCMYPGGGYDLWSDEWESLEDADDKARWFIEEGHATTGAVFIGNTLYAEYGSTITLDVIYKQGA